MVFDFGAIPPEINSARMHTGPGAGPMMAAAAAWNNLADELSTTASASESVIAELTGEGWLGPSSEAMATAAAPYVAWMGSTAAAAQYAAAQAMASAAAYEAAYAMTVPPPAIAANRAQLAALIASNLLGQNMPAIAATEAQYGEMWAQDAAAMYGYAGSSASAATLNPLTSPAPATNPGGLGAQAAAVSQAAASGSQTAGLNGVVSNMPSAVQSLAAPAAAVSGSPSSALNSFFSNNLVQNVGTTIADLSAWNGFSGAATGILFGHTYFAGLASAGSSATVNGLGASAGGGVLLGAAGPSSAASFGGAPVLAGMGSSSSVGELSVPVSWSAAAPPDAGAATQAGSGWTAPADGAGGMTAVPTGIPAVTSAGRGGYAMGPRYGVKPKVMPTQVLV